MAGMTLHLLRYASGQGSIETLRRFQAEAAAGFHSDIAPGAVPLYLRNRRTRADEFDAESALYWIIDGAFACRQRILGFEDGIDRDGRRFATMLLDPDLVAVDPRPRKNFGGWRYLDETEVPGDLAGGGRAPDGLPADMAQELRRLGLM